MTAISVLSEFSELLVALSVLLAGWLWDIRIQRRARRNDSLKDIHSHLLEIEGLVLGFARRTNGENGDNHARIEARVLQSQCHLLNKKLVSLKKRYEFTRVEIDETLIEFMDCVTGGSFPSSNEEENLQRIQKFYPISHHLMVLIEEQIC